MKRILFALFLIAAVTAAPGARLAAQSVIVNGVAFGGRLGLTLQDVTRKLAEREKLSVSEGAYVTGVSEDSPAEKAGIEEGDVVVSFHGTPITDANDLTRAVRKAPAGEPVEIIVNRSGERKTFTAKLRKGGSSFSFGDGSDIGFGHGRSYSFTVPTPPVPPTPPRNFRFHISTTQTLEGMQVQPLTKQLAEYFQVPGGKGLLVTSVDRRSPAADAGVKAGDVIAKVNGATTRTTEDLREGLYDDHPKTAELQVIRSGKAQTLTLRVEGDDEGDEDGDMEWDDDDETSFNIVVPHIDRGAMHASLSRSDRDALRELHRSLSAMKDELREKMRRLRDELRDTFRDL